MGPSLFLSPVPQTVTEEDREAFKKDLSEAIMSFPLQRLLSTVWKCGSRTSSLWDVHRLSWRQGHGLDVLLRLLLMRHFAKCVRRTIMSYQREGTEPSASVAFAQWPDPWDSTRIPEPAG